MSLKPLPNPKKLSYGGLKLQVRELARRMNLLTMMEAKTIESTGAAKFVFSEELARLDVPSVADVVASLAELKDDFARANADLQAALDACEAGSGELSPVYDVDPEILDGATASQLFTLIYYQDRDFIECSNHMELLVARHATEIKWAWRNTWIGNNVGNGSVNSSLTYPTRIPNTSNSFPDPDVYLAAKIIFRGGRDGGIETRSGTIPMTGYNRITWNGLEFAMFDAPFANDTVI